MSGISTLYNSLVPSPSGQNSPGKPIIQAGEYTPENTGNTYGPAVKLDLSAAAQAAIGPQDSPVSQSAANPITNYAVPSESTGSTANSDSNLHYVGVAVSNDPIVAPAPLLPHFVGIAISNDPLKPQNVTGTVSTLPSHAVSQSPAASVITKNHSGAPLTNTSSTPHPNHVSQLPVSVAVSKVTSQTEKPGAAKPGILAAHTLVNSKTNISKSGIRYTDVRGGKTGL